MRIHRIEKGADDDDFLHRNVRSGSVHDLRSLPATHSLARPDVLHRKARGKGSHMTPEEREEYMRDRLAALYWRWVADGKPKR